MKPKSRMSIFAASIAEAKKHAPRARRHLVYPVGRITRSGMKDCGPRDVVEVSHEYRPGRRWPQTTLRKVGWLRREWFHLGQWFSRRRWYQSVRRRWLLWRWGGRGV